MTEVVRSVCPSCRRLLTIPANWTGQTVRCKHCSHVMRVEVRQAAAAAAIPMATAAPMAVAAPAQPVTAMPTWEPLPANGQLPEYTPPVAPLPQAQRSSYVSAFEAQDKYSGRGNYRGPKNRQWLKYAVLGVFFVALAGGAGALAYKKPDLFRKSSTEPPVAGNNSGGGGINPGTTPSGPENLNPSGAFPRRMLAISIHSYLYANPLHNGDSGFALDDSKRSGTDAAIRRLAERWRVPREQLYHLTDARLLGDQAATDKKIEVKKDDALADPAPVVKKQPKVPPLKMVVEGTIDRFLTSSRAQDRIVVVFCGHALEKGGEAYLVPIEGDLDELETLIPLKWFYDRLAACPAQEKTVIFDVCRLHPERGIERPHPGPMSEALEKALHESPADVSVITSCSKGEHAIELDYLNTNLTFDNPAVKGTGINLYGSFFLSMIHGASIGGALSPEKKLPAAVDEIPVERFSTWMKEKVSDVVKSKFLSERTQTVKATLKHKTDQVAFNANEALPAHFDFPAPPPSADPKSIMAIVREIQLPTVKAFREDAPPPSISDLLPFSAESMKPYLAGELKSTDTPNEFQKAVLAGVEKIRQVRASGDRLPEEFGGDTSDRAKELLRRIQESPASVEADLQDALDVLESEAITSLKAEQAKRWQVHYDYVVAQLKLRICYVNQYNQALAFVRQGKFPDLKEGQNGYRLTAETTLDKNTGSNYKDMFKDARDALTKMAKEHPNTPWALLAKSDRSVAIGLRLTGTTVANAFR